VVSVDPISGVGTATLDFVDAGLLDSHSASFDLTVDGSSSTLTGSVNESTRRATASFDLDAGCHAVTVTGTVTDDDTGTGDGTSTNTSVSVAAAWFQAPIMHNERNIAKYGNVVPVKLELKAGCGGATVTSAPLFITMAQGTALDTFGDELVVSAVNTADTDQKMRVVDSKYMYNLATKGLTANTNYEIRIRSGATSGPVIARAVLYPKK
jgi:hypothetical protein